MGNQEEIQAGGELHHPPHGKGAAAAAVPDIRDIIEAQKISLQDIKDHLTGPLISLIIHVLFITALVSIVVEPPTVREVEVTVKDLELKEMENIPDPPMEDLQPPEINDEPPPVDQIVENVATSNAPSAAASSEVAVNVSDVVTGVAGPETDVAMPSLMSVRPSTSNLVIPGVMAMRSGAARGKALAQFGGSNRTEFGVTKALKWLRDHQNMDGSWGENGNYQPAFTGMATLAFLAHGETPSSQDFGICVLRAIKKLVEYGESSDPIRTGAGSGYGHQIFTYALCESYALTKIPMLEPVMNKNVQIIVNGQNPAGGYNYSYDNKDGRCDSSVMGWTCQAMKAGFAAGSTAQGLEQAMMKSIQCFSTLMKADTGFVYSNNIGGARPGGVGSPNVTAASTLALQLMGAGREAAAKDGVNYLIQRCNSFTWKDTPNVEFALYRWYYQTQALFQAFEGTGKEWKEWNKMFTTELLRVQKGDGHFETPARWNARAAAAAGGAVKQGGGENAFSEFDNYVYATSLCCLMLEVYYRYLPTFKVAEAKGGLPVFDEGDAPPKQPGAAEAPEKPKKRDEGGGLVIE